ncbi:hypothetical protein FisN_7Lh187 [Fistulifera solaris]|uniref:Uncharacterized protein n=1 Tax=Fistulifera solaris TaxID=1519565 RepID=A0A1Z5JD44_FISSO|nr:hypothetical protein FisN_7Lh187 [Fistulifera solaris]|eukprot:GAX11802.1 hypothetical protein FisN_7Lh187 [Fistulifera solaris]
MRSCHCWFYYSVLISGLTTASWSAFVVQVPQATRASVLLWSKVKRGQLGNTVGVATTTTTTTTTTTKKKKESKKKKYTDKSAISPDLAKWMMENPQTDDNEKTTSLSATPPKTSSRRERQSIRLAEQQVQREKIEGLVEQLEQMLDIKSENNKKTVSVPDILALVRELTQQTSSSPLTQLVGTTQRRDYRLAWVGSDDSVTHIGTGLHKVPLARLQEVFLSFPGRNRVLLQEVIRILGPFPNVRNTLSGSSRSSTRDGVTEWNVQWESMVDGTGKELLAGKEENIKSVPLRVYYSDEMVIIASRPCDDPWQGNGENVLLFLREDDLENKLEALRVA